MPNWDDLKCLMHLARGRTMTNAATALRTNVSTISRRLERLNGTICTPVITKSGNAWDLTEYGRELAEAAGEFQLLLDRLDADNSGQGSQTMVERHITLSVDSAMSPYLTRRFSSFAEKYPWIDLSIITDPERVNLAEGVVDLALMINRPEKGRVICRKVTEVALGLFYKGNAAPQKWIGLERAMEGSQEMKLGYDWFGYEPSLRISNLNSIKAAVDQTGWAGIGIAFLYPASKGYTRLGGAELVAKRDIWLGYHETRRHDRAVRAVADWVVAAFSEAENAVSHDANIMCAAPNVPTLPKARPLVALKKAS